MKYILGIIVFVILMDVVFVLFFKSENRNTQQIEWSMDNLHTIYINEVSFQVHIAEEPAELQQGLSEVAQLPVLNGILFMFPNELTHSIWMKDMRIPIDILWFDTDLRLAHIERNVSPDTYPQVFNPTVDSSFVLEINAGEAGIYNIQIGDVLTLPSEIKIGGT